MIGAIIIWSGLVTTIPANWQLCDGTNGTPDLRARFVRGAAIDGHVRDVDGAVDHSHDFTGDGHFHYIQAGAAIQGGDGKDEYAAPKEAVGTTDLEVGLPPFMLLAYIQRMS